MSEERLGRSCAVYSNLACGWGSVSHIHRPLSHIHPQSPVVVDEELLLRRPGHRGDGGDDVLQHHLGPLLHQLQGQGRVGSDGGRGQKSPP